MLNLNCSIIIKNTDTGKQVRFNYVSEIEIITSVKTFTDTAKVIVPRKLSYKGQDILEFIKRDNEIEIQIGYQDRIKTAFKGFVKDISTGTPLTITAENEAWKLKKMPATIKNYPSLTMKEFADEYLSAYDPQVADFNLGEFHINKNVTVAGVFDYIMKHYPVNFYFREGKFYGTLPGVKSVEGDDVKVIKFKVGYNTVSDNITYSRAEDIKVQIVAKTITKNNEKIEVKTPDDSEGCEVRTFLVPNISNEADLKKWAETKLADFKIDKISGDFTAFGEPYVRKGDVAHILDEDNKERHNKKFWIDAVTYTFGRGGYRQKIVIGGQLNE